MTLVFLSTTYETSGTSSGNMTYVIEQFWKKKIKKEKVAKKQRFLNLVIVCIWISMPWPNSI